MTLLRSGRPSGWWPNPWVAAAYVYTLFFVAGVGYFMLDAPIQVNDSYGNLLNATGLPLGTLVYNEFFQSSYLRPFLHGQLRVVFDLSRGDYFEWFRGWHVGQVALLSLLFVRLVRPRTPLDAAVVPLGLAALVGVHTFAGTVREAFPINTFMTILLCCYLAADLALGSSRWWRDVLAAILLVFAALTLESGLLVAVVIVTARLAGAKGISRLGIAAQLLLVAGYFVLRFLLLDVGSPGLEERRSGFGFSDLEPSELIARFGQNPLPFYAYNVAGSISSVLFAEPREGTFRATAGVVRGQLLLSSLIGIVTSTLTTVLVVGYVWRRRAEWSARRFDRRDQLVCIFAAVLAANAAMSFAYTKDVILSPAGSFAALALSVSVAHWLESLSTTSMRRLAVGCVVLLVLSSGWAYRSIGAHLGLRVAALSIRNDWAYVDFWLESEGIVPTEPFALDLKRHLQEDAFRRHPMRPEFIADWTEWFDEE